MRAMPIQGFSHLPSLQKNEANGIDKASHQNEQVENNFNILKTSCENYHANECLISNK